MAHLTDAETKKEYLKVFFGLMALTALTVVAAVLHFPESWGKAGDTLHIGIGIFIAIIKVLMVMYIFMHLKFDHPYLRFMVIVPVFLFFVLTFALNVLGP
jgi:caa(3)-type oxidase subunit IV